MFRSASIILYVDDPTTSARFYHALLGVAPIQQSPGFVLFPLPGGANLGLWRRDDVTPAGRDGELTLTTDDPDAVHALWAERGCRIIQPPTDMGFGRNVLITDPDGHRLRAFRPSGQ